MKTLRISVDQISEYSFLEFGERGENAVTEVILDFAAWVEEFGEGIVNLYVKRGGDTSAYPVPLSIDGTVATWLVSETDTYKKGRGEAEYVYVVGEKIEKTAVFGFYVNRDIGQPSTTPPSPYETWMDSLMELSNTTLKNAQDAENSAEKAETAAQHYPVIIDGYWWVWRVEEEAYVNTGVKAEGQGFTIKGTVATVDDLPSDATQGDFWNVGTHDPYTIYMYQDGDGWVSQGTLKGETGTTFTPSVSEEGVISWTNDGELPNPEPRNIRGPKGIQGDKGDTGDAAGFGQPTATVNQSTGQASVEVSASGPDTAKVFNFAFSGIKGERGIQGDKGETGDAAGFGQPTASVDANVGTPSVTVTSSGPDTAKVFDFQFKNIKGNKGDTGNGITSVALVSTSGLDKTYRITFTESNPVDFVVHDGRGISSVTLNNDYTLTINFTDGTSYTTDKSIRGEKGETGDKGDTGDPAGFGTPTASVDANSGTPSVTVTASGPNTAKVFNFQFKNLRGIDGRNGDKGDTGNGISGISLVSTSGLDKTYRVTFTESSPFDFIVHDGRGISSVVLNADYTLTINFTDGTNYTTTSIRGEKGETGEPGKNFTVEDYVATPADLPSGVDVGTVYGVGTSEPYDIYIYSASQGWVNNGTIQGPSGATGTTFTPTVSSAGVISWTNDGDLPNPTSVNIKGPQGNTGTSAGFGTPTASASQTTGTPSVTVSASGPNTAKVFDFQFSGIKGETGDTGTTFTPSVSSDGVISWTNDGGKTNPSSVNIRGPQGLDGNKGETGDAAGFGTPTATVGTGTGTPSVSVTASGPDTAKVFSFAFDGLKGTPGANGEGVPTGGTAGQFLKKSSGTDFDTEWDTVEVPTKVSDLTNDTGFITGMEILSYGSSTWQDFLDAFNAKKVVYCRASSNSNPATGSQGRMAFMAFVNFSGTTPTSVEFQYYRSVSSHTEAQQGDQVFIYKLESSGAWSVTTREASSKIVAGTNMSSSYSSGTLTLNATDTTYESKAAASGGTDLSLVTTGEKYNWNTRDIPSGGTTGQVLKKSSDSDYAVEWGAGASYESKAAASGGTDLSLVTTGEKYTWNNKVDKSSAVTSVTFYKTGHQGQGIYQTRNSATTLIVGLATSSSGGLMSSSDKEKLDSLTTPVILRLFSDNDGEYQDSPTGPFSVYTNNYGDISHLYNDADKYDIKLNYGVINLESGGTSAYIEEYRLVSAESTNGETPVITLTFRALSMRNGLPVVKTVTVSEEPYSWDSLEGATVTYSETALAVQS